jgi:hypothetical protein
VRTFAILISLVAACAPTWVNAQAPTEIAAVGALACDGLQTEQFLAHADQAGLVESNVILGAHPSSYELWTYLAVIGFGLVVVNKTLPPRAAVIVNAAVLAIEGQAIGVNAYYGASLACGAGAWSGGPTSEFQTQAGRP